jgi:hypothetical protein
MGETTSEAHRKQEPDDGFLEVIVWEVLITDADNQKPQLSSMFNNAHSI